MNQEQAIEWLPMFQAVAEGKTIQYKCNDRWVDDVDLRLSTNPEGRFRIKPEPKKQWYRVALLKNREGAFFTLNADSSEPYKEPEKAFIEEYGKDFVGWLTDRVEYELPEVEA